MPFAVIHLTRRSEQWIKVRTGRTAFARVMEALGHSFLSVQVCSPQWHNSS